MYHNVKAGPSGPSADRDAGINPTRTLAHDERRKASDLLDECDDMASASINRRNAARHT